MRMAVFKKLGSKGEGVGYGGVVRAGQIADILNREHAFMRVKDLHHS